MLLIGSTAQMVSKIKIMLMIYVRLILKMICAHVAEDWTEIVGRVAKKSVSLKFKMVAASVRLVSQVNVYNT